jgi:hypothetical protein
VLGINLSPGFFSSKSKKERKEKEKRSPKYASPSPGLKGMDSLKLQRSVYKTANMPD